LFAPNAFFSTLLYPMMTPRRLLNVVRDPSRDASNGFHLLRHSQLSFEHSFFCHILRKHFKVRRTRFSSVIRRPEHRTVIGAPSCRFHSISMSLISSRAGREAPVKR